MKKMQADSAENKTNHMSEYSKMASNMDSVASHTIPCDKNVIAYISIKISKSSFWKRIQFSEAA